MECIIENCSNTNIMAKGMCNAHYLRLKRYGRLHSIKRPYGSGGFRKDGYKIISTKNGRILEHRHILEEHLGRKLNKSEIIHHINKDRTDNNIENMILTTHSSHRSLHIGEPRKPFTETARLNMSIAGKKAVKKHYRDSITGRFSSKK